MKRPGIITLVCTLGYISILFSFPSVFSPSVKKLGTFMPALYGIIVAMSFISYVGIWYLKQWGVSMFAIAFFAKTIFFMLTGQTGFGFYFGLVFHVFFLVVMLAHYRGMSRDL